MSSTGSVYRVHWSLLEVAHAGGAARSLIQAWRSWPVFAGQTRVTAIPVDRCVAVTLELPADDAIAAARRSFEVLERLLDAADLPPSRALIVVVQRAA